MQNEQRFKILLLHSVFVVSSSFVFEHNVTYHGVYVTRELFAGVCPVLGCACQRKLEPHRAQVCSPMQQSTSVSKAMWRETSPVVPTVMEKRGS